MNSFLLRLGNFIAFGVQMYVNINASHFNNGDGDGGANPSDPHDAGSTAHLRNVPRVWVVPAAYAFAIWGLIYAFCLFFTIYQLFVPGTYNKTSDGVYANSETLISERIGLLFGLFVFFFSILHAPLSN